MNIAIKNIINSDLFVNAEFIAGVQGLENSVSRVSVFDSPFGYDVIEKNIIRPGDFFITGLLNFDESQVSSAIAILIQAKSSGLCVISSDKKELFTDDTIQYCNREHFPVIYVTDDISYAEMMDAFNRHIAQETLNSMNQFRLEKIMNESVPKKEKMELLSGINPSIAEQVQAIFFDTHNQSRLEDIQWQNGNLISRTDVFIHTGRYRVLILSDNDLKNLSARRETLLQVIKRNYLEYVIGVGRICTRAQIGQALQEAREALTAAVTLNSHEEKYDPISVFGLLLQMKGSSSLQEFYEGFCERIAKATSADGNQEYMATLRMFVACAGDYKRVATEMKQHENTIRYRISRMKAILGLEHSMIEFYEMLGILVKIEKILGVPV